MEADTLSKVTQNAENSRELPMKDEAPAKSDSSDHTSTDTVLSRYQVSSAPREGVDAVLNKDY